MQKNVITDRRDRSRENKNTSQPITAGGVQHAIKDERNAHVLQKAEPPGTGAERHHVATDLMQKNTNQHPPVVSRQYRAPERRPDEQ
jgi:hypothetical protein